mmetsp:Transcript_32611/g.91787  ORF Transcript_32611/g.91787 Transcript_32611/m.91787 type:complete len:253 (-) Transcript_32611:279-1037(-)
MINRIRIHLQCNTCHNCVCCQHRVQRLYASQLIANKQAKGPLVRRLQECQNLESFSWVLILHAENKFEGLVTNPLHHITVVDLECQIQVSNVDQVPPCVLVQPERQLAFQSAEKQLGPIAQGTKCACDVTHIILAEVCELQIQNLCSKLKEAWRHDSLISQKFDQLCELINLELDCSSSDLVASSSHESLMGNTHPTVCPEQRQQGLRSRGSHWQSLEQLCVCLVIMEQQCVRLPLRVEFPECEYHTHHIPG